MSAQHYIPVSRSFLRNKIIEDFSEKINGGEHLNQISQLMEAIWHHRAHQGQEQLKSLYEKMNPDVIGERDLSDVSKFLEIFSEMLEDGNWQVISEEELEIALNETAVFPINLDVRFDEFEEMRLYKLGELQISDSRNELFGFRQVSFTVDAYDRVVQVLKFKPRSWFEENKRLKHYPGDEVNGLHLRLFNTIPKPDLEVIFPNTSPQMRFQDKAKIIAPLLGGLVTLVLKFGPVLLFHLFGIGSGEQGELSISVLGGMLAAFASYIFKTYMSYLKTRENYLSQVSKTLYFKGQANNAAVLGTIVDLSEEQEVKEALLAYVFLLADSEHKHTEKSLDGRIESWLADELNITVDFEVDDALGKLSDLSLLSTSKSGTLKVVTPPKALELLDSYWDDIYTYSV